LVDRRSWSWPLVAVAAAAAAFGCYLRFADNIDAFCQIPDELAEMMPGIRLHALPFLNLGDPIRYNFFQSMFYSQHGLGDVSLYYLASGLLSLLHLPVSERYLFAVGGVTNIGLAIAGGLLTARVLRRPSAGWIFAILVFVSPFWVFVSKTGWGRLTWTPLLVVLLFLCQQRAMTRRGAWSSAAFWALAGFISLTDGFVLLPLIGVLGLLLVEGPLPQRLRRLASDRVFVSACAVAAIGVAAELAMGLAARRRGTTLTMMAYAMLRGGAGGLVPSSEALRSWAHAVDYYFPFNGGWTIVAAAWVLAVADGMRGRMIGLVAAWWLLASLGVLRYSQAMVAIHNGMTTWLSSSQLAVPSLLLVAWLIGEIVDRRGAIADRVSPLARAGALLAVVVALAGLMAKEATRIAFDSGSSSAFDTPIEHLVHYRIIPLSACRTVKTAAFYVRSHQSGVPYVFHLASSVYLGPIGEFYYGLSYGRSPRPEDPNHLLDFGRNQFGRDYPPEAFAGPYGLDRFDYYVEFVDNHDALTQPTIDELLAQGARVVCTVTDGGRTIGRILSFHGEAPITIDYKTAAAGWDRAFGRASTLLQQPLAGTAYHFGYNWRPPVEP